MFPLWLLGCIISLTGSIGAIFGTNVQKLSFTKNEALPASARRVYWRQPLWLAGLFLVFLGGVGDFVSLGLAPQSTIAALGSVPLVANVILAHWWLGESISIRDGIGTSLIIVGSVLSVVFGDHRDAEYTIADLKALYAHTGYITFGSILLALLALMWTLCSFICTPMRIQLIEAIDALNTMKIEQGLMDEDEEEQQDEWNTETDRDMGQTEQTEGDGVRHERGTQQRTASQGDAPHDLTITEQLRQPLLCEQPSSSYHEQEANPSSVSATHPRSTPPADLTINTVTSPTTVHVAPTHVHSPTYPSQSTDGYALSTSSSCDTLPIMPCTDPFSAARDRVIKLEHAYAYWSRLHPVFYCVISGVFGSLAIQTGKCVAVLVANVLKEGEMEEFKSPFLYIFALSLGCCLLGQIHFFSVGLDFWDVLFVAPVFKCSFLTLSTLGGAFYFQELSTFGLKQWILFPLGLVINLAGVYVLSSRKMRLAGIQQQQVLRQQSEASMMGTDADMIDEGACTAGEGVEGEQSISWPSMSIREESIDHTESDRIARMQVETYEAEGRALADASQKLLQSAAELAASEQREGCKDSEITQDSDMLLVASPVEGLVVVASRNPHPQLSSPPGPRPRPSLRIPRVLETHPWPPAMAQTIPEDGAEGIGRVSDHLIEPNMLTSPPLPPVDETDVSNIPVVPSPYHLEQSSRDRPPTIRRFSSSTSSESHHHSHHSLYPSISSASLGSLASRTSHTPSLYTSTSLNTQAGQIDVSLWNLPMARHASLSPLTSSAASPFPPIYPSIPEHGTLGRAATEEGPRRDSLHSIDHFLSIPQASRSASLNVGVGARGHEHLIHSPRPISSRASSISSACSVSTARTAPVWSHSSDTSLHRPSDVIVQRGSKLYRMPTDTSVTPLDSSRSRPGPSSSTSNAPRRLLRGFSDALPQFLTPGSGSSFSVTSPWTQQEYRMPRDERSIFKHTRRYMDRLSKLMRRQIQQQQHEGAAGGRSLSSHGRSVSNSSKYSVRSSPAPRTALESMSASSSIPPTNPVPHTLNTLPPPLIHGHSLDHGPDSQTSSALRSQPADLSQQPTEGSSSNDIGQRCPISPSSDLSTEHASAPSPEPRPAHPPALVNTGIASASLPQSLDTNAEVHEPVEREP